MSTAIASGRGREDKAITSLRSRLNRWELPHLRQLAASLHEQLEEAERRAEDAERCAEMWQSIADQLQEELRESGHTAKVGLTMQGDLLLLEGCTQ